MDSKSLSLNQEQIKKLLRKVLPAIIRNMLAEGRIDKDKLGNRKYILNVIDKGQDIIDETGVVFLMHDHFLASAQDAITANRPEVAVVLIATAIEQVINQFYREVLMEKGLLNYDEITELIRTTNFNAKIGWLFTIVAGYDIDTDFRKKISVLMELRNQIVHYKAISTPMKDYVSQSPIEQRIQEFGLDRISEIPNELSELLNEALEIVYQESPDYKLAMDAVQLFLQ